MKIVSNGDIKVKVIAKPKKKKSVINEDESEMINRNDSPIVHLCGCK